MFNTVPYGSMTLFGTLVMPHLGTILALDSLNLTQWPDMPRHDFNTWPSAIRP